jgi:glutaredoxin-related protein
LARKALNDLEEKGQIKKVVGHSKLSIYSEWHRIPQVMVMGADGGIARAVTAAE